VTDTKMAALAAAAIAAATITPEKAITHDDLLLPRKVLRMTSAAYGGDRYRRCVLRWTARSGRSHPQHQCVGPAPTSHERGLVGICRRLDTCLPPAFRNISTWTVETGLPDNMSSLASKSAWSA
jgi:hypothetical protein